MRIPPLGTVGFHPAELPKNRGRHPLIWAIVLGLSRTASTFFMIEPGVDNGDIVSQVSVSITGQETAQSLYDKIMAEAINQVIAFTQQFEDGSIVLTPQDNSAANTWRKRGENDGLIDFRMRAETICRLVRALSAPYVGAYFVYKEEKYKVHDAEVITDTAGYENVEFGKVLSVKSNRSFLVKADDGLVNILDCDDILLEAGDYL